MLKVISLKCSSCGANLEISPEMTSFACGYCGASQVVQRSGGTISLELLTNAISQVRVGTDKTAAELALKRIQGELQETEFAYQNSDNQRIFQKDKIVLRFKRIWFVLTVFTVVPALMVGS